MSDRESETLDRAHDESMNDHQESMDHDTEHMAEIVASQTIPQSPPVEDDEDDEDFVADEDDASEQEEVINNSEDEFLDEFDAEDVDEDDAMHPGTIEGKS